MILLIFLTHLSINRERKSLVTIQQGKKTYVKAIQKLYQNVMKSVEVKQKMSKPHKHVQVKESLRSGSSKIKA